MKDGRISALLDSNNDLSLELTQNNQTIRELEIQNDSLKSGSPKVNAIKPLIQRIKNQKSDYDRTFRGNEYSLVLSDPEIEFMQSEQFSSEDDVKTQEDVEQIIKDMTRASCILSKLNKARVSYNKCLKYKTEPTQTESSIGLQNELKTAFEAQKQTIQKLENEIKILKETTAAVHVESETVDMVATYESLDEPSIKYNDLSTQTDFTPTLSFEAFNELNSLRYLPALARITILKKKESQKESAMNQGLETRKRWFDQFQLAFQRVIYRDQIKLDNTTTMSEDFKIQQFKLSDLHRESSTVVHRSITQHCSTQTEISTLLVGLNFEKILPSDDLRSQVQKINARLVTLSENQAQLETQTDRLKQYCDDLDAGKEIIVMKTDLSESNLRIIQFKTLRREKLEEMKEFKQKVAVLLKRLKNQKQNLSSQWSTKAFLVDKFKADFDYAESIQLPTESEVKNEEEFNKLKQVGAQLTLLLGKFHTAYNDFKKGKLVVQSPAIIADNAVHYDDLSTQTDIGDKNFRNQETSTNDLEGSSSSKLVDDMQLIQTEIFAQLERKVKSTLNFEIDAAIKKSTESFKNLQVTSNRSYQSSHIDELENKILSKDNLIDDQSKRITEMETKLSKQISDEESKISLLIVENVEAERKLRCEQLKLKEFETKLKGKESEISKLNTKISNQSKCNTQQQTALNAKRKEIEKLKMEAKKTSSQQTSQSELNRLKTKIRQVLKLMLDFLLAFKLKLKTDRLGQPPYHMDHMSASI